MKRFKDFLIENIQDKWVYDGNFEATEDMVIDGKMIKEKIPNEVTGYFDCSGLELTTLEGCPLKVGSFNCSYNKLTSLKGCPKTIVDFHCSHNNLTSLEGSPTTVSGDFDCSNNKLTSLEGCPTTVSEDFYCHNNLKDLTIERDFIESGRYSSKENYWLNLLKYMIDEKIDLDKVIGWPKGFLRPEIIDSVKSINKFNL